MLHQPIFTIKNSALAVSEIASFLFEKGVSISVGYKATIIGWHSGGQIIAVIDRDPKLPAFRYNSSKKFICNLIFLKPVP
jgi:hypothetical protein